ncbi:hypothetical protein [Cardinium endosymbiont of Nabis limbatus]|uniref:hypothetical protein n=1 Tax=Cardinium endosymbiont of Nabis limbatus TaxID=3066217 RepID=UPI003AF3AB58
MKIKSNFLLALSAISLSCTNLMQPTIFNIDEYDWQNAYNTTVDSQALMGQNGASDKKPCPYCIATLNALKDLIEKYYADIKYYEDIKYYADVIKNKIVGYGSHQPIDNSGLHSKPFSQPWRGATSNSNEIDSPLALATYIAISSNFPTILLEFICFLEQAGIKIDLNAKTLFGRSAFHYAIASGHRATLGMLMHKAPLVHNQQDQVLDFPALFDYAMNLGKQEIAEDLLEYLVGRAQEAPLQPIYGQHKAIHFVDLLDYAIYLNKKERAKHLLQDIITLVKQGLLTHLYREGKNIDYVDLLDYAIRLGKQEIAEDLLENLIKNDPIKNLHQQDIHGQTTLMHIAYSMYPGLSKIFKALLIKNADITIQDRDGQNVLMHLCTRLGYTYATNYNPNNNNQALCDDKKEMLKWLFNHKDILKIIGHVDKNGKNILTYANDLLDKISKVDLWGAADIRDIFNLLLDVGFNA